MIKRLIEKYAKAYVDEEIRKMQGRIEAINCANQIEWEKAEVERKAKETAYYASHAKHAAQVEGYLAGFNKLLEKLEPK